MSSIMLRSGLGRRALVVARRRVVFELLNVLEVELVGRVTLGSSLAILGGNGVLLRFKPFLLHLPVQFLFVLLFRQIMLLVLRLGILLLRPPTLL